MEHLEPAKTVIAKLGGPEAAAKLTGRSLARVYRWMYPPERGGTGGAIPHDVARTILEKAPGVVTPSDFFPSSERAA